LTQQPLRFRNSHADRLAEAQLRKSGRSNLAPGCWESCLISKSPTNSPDQVGRQAFSLWNRALQIFRYTWAHLS
ncbi:hypothetical protein T4B_5133, partial [Trichinella pseudospiralis]